jgi:hypothetical protein
LRRPECLESSNAGELALFGLGYAAMSGPSDPKAPKGASGAELDAEAIDSAWEDPDEDVAEPDAERPPRERMATLHDEDPLRHDIGYRRDRDPTRDSRPTLPVIDPLKYDVEPESEEDRRKAGEDASGVRRRVP